MEWEIDHLRSVAESAARAAGKELRGGASHMVSSLGKDIKIDADKRAHQTILAELQISEIPVLSEEDDVHHFDAKLKWVVDPLDGSMNYLRGIPTCAVSIALMEDDKPILGVVFDFNRDELFSGIVGVGATCNGTAISVSQIDKKENAVLFSGFPSYTDYSNEALRTYIELIQSFKKVRLIGSAALSLAYVASGRGDIYYEKDIKIWDVAAGLALIKAAGGVHAEFSVGEEGRCTVHAGNGLIDIGKGPIFYSDTH